MHTLAGSGKLQQQLCGLKFQLSPLAFFQTNTKQAEVMYNVVAEAAGVVPSPPIPHASCIQEKCLWG